MYNNIGKKIKTLAKVVAWIGIIISVIGGMILGAILNGWLALLIILIGSVVSWLSNFILYAFGELVDNSTIIANSVVSQTTSLPTVTQPNYQPTYQNVSPTGTQPYYDTTSNPNTVSKPNTISNPNTVSRPNTISNSNTVSKPNTVIENKWKCPSCGRINQHYITTCICGTLNDYYDTAPKAPDTVIKNPSQNEWKCPSCGRINRNYVTTCICGTHNTNDD